MSGDVVLRAEGLGKEYRIPGEQGRARSTFRRVRSRAQALVRGRIAEALGSDARFWALRDISFEVRRGEALGIIGRNGAGKSTLLKILSRITEPTEGHAEIHGRLGSLLQVGAGFHNELTGRENVFLNGSILGMSAVQIQRRFESIVDFAEIGRFLDTPIKHYSSGMRVRLGFSIAINLDPEVLLLDEVFSVGDAAFRQKCVQRLSVEIGNGRTVLFVSHNMEQVRTLVDRCMVLEAGRITFLGDPQDGVERYMQMAAMQRSVLSFPMERECAAQVERCYVRGESGVPTELAPFNRPLTVRVEFIVYEADPATRLGVVVAFCNDSGQFLALLSTDDMPGAPAFARAGRYYFDVTVPASTFNPIELTVRPAISANGRAIHNHPRFGHGLAVSLIDPESDRTIKRDAGKGSALLAIELKGECGVLNETLPAFDRGEQRAMTDGDMV